MKPSRMLLLIVPLLLVLTSGAAAQQLHGGNRRVVHNRGQPRVVVYQPYYGGYGGGWSPWVIGNIAAIGIQAVVYDRADQRANETERDRIASNERISNTRTAADILIYGPPSGTASAQDGQVSVSKTTPPFNPNEGQRYQPGRYPPGKLMQQGLRAMPAYR